MRKARVIKGSSWFKDAEPIQRFREFFPYLIQDAELNPNPRAQCTIWVNGEEKGPFTPGQIRSMWNAGNLTADTLFIYEELNEWRPIKSFCQIDEVDTNIGSESDGSASIVLGVMLIIFGLVSSLYFISEYDVSVKTEKIYLEGVGFIGGDSVVNLGRQQNRLIGVGCSVVVVFFGGGLLAFRKSNVSNGLEN